MVPVRWRASADGELEFRSLAKMTMNTPFLSKEKERQACKVRFRRKEHAWKDLPCLVASATTIREEATIDHPPDRDLVSHIIVMRREGR